MVKFFTVFKCEAEKGSCRAFGGSDNLPDNILGGEFQILDEVNEDDNDDEGTQSDSSDESSMSYEIPNEEIDALLEEGLPGQGGSSNSKDKSSPHKKKNDDDAEVDTNQQPLFTYVHKTVIPCSDDLYGPFDRLPEGWVMITHASGIHVYLHRGTRVCTLSRPYFIGQGSTRRHDVPLSAIPCLLHKKKKEERMKRLAEEESRAKKSETSELCDKESSVSVDQPNTTDNSACINSSSSNCPMSQIPEFSNQPVLSTSSNEITNEQSLTARESSHSSCASDLLRTGMSENENSNSTGDECGKTTTPSDLSQKTNPDNSETPTISSLEHSPESSGNLNAIASDAAIVTSTTCGNTNPDDNSNAESVKINAKGKERSSTFNTALAVALNIEPANPPPTADQLPGSHQVTFERPVLAVVEAQELNAYCSNLFEFKVILAKKFPSWNCRRKHEKRMKKIQPMLPEGTKLLSLKPNTNPEEEMAFKKKKWLLNPANRSSICILHEYVQYVMKTKPTYKFKEVDNASCPYAAALFIDGMEYATGYGSSKKLAKAEAAAATLSILVPELGAKFQSNKDKPDDSDTTFFDQIRIEDPNVPELCNRMSEVPPYSLLLVCLQRNYCMDNNNITCQLIPHKGQKNEFEMTVGKHTVRVPCKNKKEGKQKASQALLQKLHPHIVSWGSMLRLYGNKSLQELKAKKKEEQEVTNLQNNATANQPNYSIINLLKKEMLKLHAERLAIRPIGEFIPPENISLPVPSSTDLNTLDI
ncbi:hypothetical protein HAZT_HAZT005765 [Hyalella azteca]|uniref:DRBM domain-containing protein n=1 Tax=Hyalella azteca TaxID=294128 RepID=A0A6A0GY33_HYAAZ|nr:hypothetical protein HAZT_HAZT005765 [Hyalella azteca]